MDKEKIVRILLNHTETLSTTKGLIQVIPNGDIEDIADEISNEDSSKDRLPRGRFTA